MKEIRSRDQGSAVGGGAGENYEEKSHWLLALGALLFALCSSAEAQQTGKISRIGFLDPSTASGSAVLRGGVPAGAEQTWLD